MRLNARKVDPPEISSLRDLYRQEMNCQIIHDSWHARGWTNCFLFEVDGRVAGYGQVGGIKSNPRDIVTEFYVLPGARARALALFRLLIAESAARTVEAQTNDRLLTLMLYDCAVDIRSETILFADALATTLSPPGAAFRPARGEQVFPHAHEPEGEWVIEVGGEIAATGGILFHYNIPYGDIYMEVAEPFRRRGYGSYLVQELKRVCCEMGRIPAARCSVNNHASRATLQKAGLLPCARILTGRLDP